MDRDPCGDSIWKMQTRLEIFNPLVPRLGPEFGLLESSEKVRNLAGECECEVSVSVNVNVNMSVNIN